MPSSTARRLPLGTLQSPSRGSLQHQEECRTATRSASRGSRRPSSPLVTKSSTTTLRYPPTTSHSHPPSTRHRAGGEFIVGITSTISSGGTSYGVSADPVRRDCPPPEVSSLAASASTVDEGSGTVTITATLDQPPINEATARLTISGTATLSTSNSACSTGADFRVDKTLFTFAAGATSDTITVTACDDTEDDDGETVTLTMQTPTGEVQLGTPGTVTITIIDDDTSSTDFGYGL